ncbi:Exodeoxyribonuclease VII large subunit [Synechococcus sp. PCC 7502]|uniref:exodeoxyribonuclease VII large subunit n=1 Tax=Synechococcus sp. PCC 7502 TaxID=1173263 RepID=UPI00029FD305|nr:exodeoxyribonuclease VII large subunit [Synechococcus sp. PCC 7502]AFY74771.1 Exodeoxyribonuclease VII large subunit [Synechococcus sp. PCC 7502]
MSRNNTQISVTALTQKITKLLRESIGEVRVLGEISGYKAASSGHRYFTLKDDESQIDCVLWGSKQISFMPSDGMRVIVTGKLTVYATRGKYQIDCQSLIPAGQGELYLAFERLKQDLADGGFFDRKRPIPALPLHIGIVTSPTGAAIQDMLSTLNRRSPHCQIYLCPASVQGEYAAQEIANAITRLNQVLAGFNNAVLIVGRGGGSLEDLWAFNTLPVAEAIYNSEIPIISAVGHETDFTIADFVADVRVATPTAAAELVTQSDRNTLLGYIQAVEQELTENIQAVLESKKQKIDRLINSYGFQKLGDRLKNYSQRVDEAENALTKLINRNLKTARTKLDALEAHGKSLYPLSPLGRGFALLQDGNHIISASESLSEFDQIAIVRNSEVAHATIQTVKPKLTYDHD